MVRLARVVQYNGAKPLVKRFLRPGVHYDSVLGRERLGLLLFLPLEDGIRHCLFTRE